MTQANNQGSKKTGKIILGVGLVVALVAVMVFLYFQFSPKATQGSKSITIEVINDVEESKVFEVKTDAEYLTQAMEETEGLTFSGAESEYGIMIDTVNGVKADYNENGAYWLFVVNGEACSYGADAQPVNDKDAFSIIYTIGE